MWCPRCGEAVAPDVDQAGAWICGRHGRVPGLHGFAEPSVHVLLDHVTRTAGFPTWLPWPMPGSWSLSGVGLVGDRPTVASVVACSGPDPLGGLGDLVVVAEEPGTGLGGRYAGLSGSDPGPAILARPADAKVVVGGRPTPLWHLDGPEDRATYVGEASGRWLWVVGWPVLATAAVLLEATAFVDLAGIIGELELMPLSGLSARLTDP